MHFLVNCHSFWLSQLDSDGDCYNAVTIYVCMYMVNECPCEPISSYIPAFHEAWHTYHYVYE